MLILKYSASQVRKDNEQRILTALMQQRDRRLRWNELRAKTGLSKRTLSLILRDLASEKRRIVTRILDVESKEYPPPVYYELAKEEALTPTDIFLNHLRSISGTITEEAFARGRLLLEENIFVSLNTALLTIVEPIEFGVNLEDFFGSLDPQLLRKEEKTSPPNMTKSILDLYMFKDTQPSSVSEEREKKLRELASTDKGFMIWATQQILNPYVFHSLLRIYYLEKINERLKVVVPDAFKLSNLVKNQNLEKQLDQIWEWWSKDIVVRVNGLIFLDRIIHTLWARAVGHHVSYEVLWDAVTPTFKKIGIPLEKIFEPALDRYFKSTRQ